MVKSKLPPGSGSSLEAVEPHPEKGAMKFFLITKLNLAKFCCQKPKTLPATLIWGERGFFTEK